MPMEKTSGDPEIDQLRKEQKDSGWRISGEEMQDALDIIGWGNREFARRCFHSEKTVRRWIKNQLPIPVYVAQPLIELAIYHERTIFRTSVMNQVYIGKPNLMR
jgi:hypothetical protein